MFQIFTQKLCTVININYFSQIICINLVWEIVLMQKRVWYEVSEEQIALKIYIYKYCLSAHE